MNDFTRTIINGLKTYIQKSRGNWNQNDETAVDYIKNRTHWSEEKFADIISDTTVSNPVIETEDFNLFDLTFKHIKEVPNFTANTEYTVTWNGTEYKCVAKAVAEAGGIVCLGNVKKMLGTGDTSEPFLIIPDTLNQLSAIEEDVLCRVASFDGSTSFIFKVSGLTTVIHKIDKKYLPEISSIKNILDGSAKGSVRTIEAYNEIGRYAFAEGYRTTASGDNSHAEGWGTTASKEASHAEGWSTTASGYTSHAEGEWTTASGDHSHAEGYRTTASGDNSHAEGAETIASGDHSHAEGGGTTASGDFSHVQGRFNIEDTENKYAHIVGNGEYSYDDSKRSNAHTLDWNGNAWFLGDIYLGGTGQEDYVTKVVTEKTISQPKDYISFKDIENNFIYILQMKNGNLVSRRTISRIEITKMPNKLNYTEGEIFNPEGMEVVGHCEDGNIIIINNYTYPKTPISSNIITISYEEVGKTYIENINISISPFNPEEALIDFYYTTNEDGTYTITDWKGTYNGVSSTKIIVPDNGLIKI